MFYEELSPHARTALYVSGYAAIAGIAAYFLWPKSASAETSKEPDPSDTAHWTPQVTLDPGNVYVVASLLNKTEFDKNPTKQAITNDIKESGVWYNIEVLYIPGDPRSAWPKAIPRPTNQDMMGTMAVFIAKWVGPPGTAIDASRTMMPMKWTG
jgi:hypothetical protein